MGYWIDTFVSEKGYSLNETFVVVGESGMRNIIRLGEVVDEIKSMPPSYQEKVKNSLVKLDFKDPDLPLKFFRVMAQAIAK